MDNNNQICGDCHRSLQNLTTDGVIAISRNGKKAKALCLSCLASYNTCAKCKNNITCAFQSYSGPEPKIINQTIRQGNMVMQTQVPNPAIVEKTCGKCLCSYEDLGCMRQQGYCGNLFVEGWDELPISTSDIPKTSTEASTTDEVTDSNNSDLGEIFPPEDTTINSTGNEEVSGISDTMRETSQDETHDPDEDSSIAPQPQCQENTNAAKDSV